MIFDTRSHLLGILAVTKKRQTNKANLVRVRASMQKSEGKH